MVTGNVQALESEKVNARRTALDVSRRPYNHPNAIPQSTRERSVRVRNALLWGGLRESEIEAAVLRIRTA